MEDLFIWTFVTLVLAAFPFLLAKNETGASGARKYRYRDGRFMSYRTHIIRLVAFYAIVGTLIAMNILS